MITLGRIKKGAYHDSVSLMRVGKSIAGTDGVAEAALVMGTKSNLGILKASGLLISDFAKATDTDLLLAVKARDAKTAEAALNAAEAALKSKAAVVGTSSGETRPSDLDGAVKVLPDANLALISVAGRYAGTLAMRCLEKGLHVMLFSDNVPIEKEIELKKFAAKKGLLVMGPDCGTAIINGIPLAFANVVRRGPIGIVAAAGTGLQEVSTIISNEGSGISQAIGTGGRDVKKEVGGIMFLAGLKALAADPQTKVILLVSKPPHPSVLNLVRREVRRIRKPVVSLLLGAEGDGPKTLEAAALQAVALATGRKIEDLQDRAGSQSRPRRARGRRKYVRGLFSGGTFCAEAQIILEDTLGQLYSNAPTGRAKQLKDSLKSQKHSFVDLGEDEFTVGRPHPMIDFSLRNKRILAEAADPETAVILLDVVLGYGSNMDPAAELAPVIRTASRKVPVVCSVTGTDGDPQNLSRVEKALRTAGAVVMPSNAAACRLAGTMAKAGGK